MTKVNERVERQLDRALTALQSDTTPDLAQLSPEVGDLLRLAQVVERGLRPPGPADHFRRSAQRRILNLLRHRSRKDAARPLRSIGHGFLTGLMRRPALAIASLLLTVALIGTSAGVVYAAEASLPGDALYRVKLGLEQTRLRLTWSNGWRLELLEMYAERRQTEVQQLELAGRDQDMGPALDGYVLALGDLVTELETSGLQAGDPALQGVDRALNNHLDTLQTLITQAPSAALDKAVDHSEHGLEVLEAIQSGQSPSDLAPGRIKQTDQAEDDQPGGGPKGTPGPPPGRGPNGTPGPPAGVGPPDGVGNPNN